jgi:hypothetical protein
MVLRGDEVHVEAHFSPFGDNANLDARLLYGLRRMHHYLRKLFQTHPMELLGDMGLVESCFGPIGDGVSIAAREVHGLHGTYHRLENHFGRTRWYF